MTLSELRRPIKSIFWAYFLIYINFNLNSLNLLPAWAGYLMLYRWLDALSPEQPSLKLLRPFSLLLAAAALWDWLSQLLGGLPQLPGWLSVTAGLITLYFHFQLFTDLADLAQRRGVPPAGPDSVPVGGLLGARTIQALLHTCLLLTPLMEWLQNWEVVAAMGLIAYFIVILVILRQLYVLRRRFPDEGQL